MKIRYITFETSEEFEEWQSTYNPQIRQCTPLARELNFDSSNTDKTESEIVYGIFVLYSDFVNEEKL